MNQPTHSQLIAADDHLASVFSHFYCVAHSPDAEPISQQLLPNYEMLLVFNFGPEVPIRLGTHSSVVRQTAVVGPLQKTLTYELPAGANFVVINFNLDGFYRLFRMPMQQLTDENPRDPDVLLNSPCFGNLWARLNRLDQLSERLRVISEFLLEFAQPSEPASLPLMDSIPYFESVTEDPIKALSQKHQLSTRSVQLRFQTYLGYSAKEMVRFLRFKKVLTFLYRQQPNAVDWADVVLQFGYHDQSHLIKDFQHFLDLSPRQFLHQLAQGDTCMSQPGKYY